RSHLTRRPAPVAADFDDILRFHPGSRASVRRHWRRRRLAPLARNCCVRRYARGHAAGHFLRPGPVLRNREPRREKAPEPAHADRDQRAGVRRLNPRWLILASGALLITGCTVGPNYHRPPVAVPGQFRNAPLPSGPNSIAD